MSSYDSSMPGEVDPVHERREDLHWLALQLYRRLGTAELPAVRRHGLSLWGYEVLTHLAEHPATSQLELGAALRLDKSKVVRIVDELEAAGFATRSPGRGDRRRRTISATSAGDAARAATRIELDHIERALLEQLPGADRDALRRGLRALVTALAGAVAG